MSTSNLEKLRWAVVAYLASNWYDAVVTFNSSSSPTWTSGVNVVDIPVASISFPQSWTSFFASSPLVSGEERGWGNWRNLPRKSDSNLLAASVLVAGHEQPYFNLSWEWAYLSRGWVYLIRAWASWASRACPESLYFGSHFGALWALAIVS